MPKTKPTKMNPEKALAWKEFYEELQQESQRGGVLVGAAFLDEHLRQILEGFLVDHKVSRNVLDPESPTAPLSDFSSRIDMAFCLGLMSEDMHNDLHIIRRIRNQFGHSAYGVTLDHEWFQEEIDKLNWPKKKFAGHSDFWDNAGPGDVLLTSISMHASRLRINALDIKDRRRIRPNEKIAFYVGGDKKKEQK